MYRFSHTTNKPLINDCQHFLINLKGIDSVIKTLVYDVKNDAIEKRTFRNEEIFEAWFNNTDSETEYTIVDISFPVKE